MLKKKKNWNVSSPLQELCLSQQSLLFQSDLIIATMTEFANR